MSKADVVALFDALLTSKVRHRIGLEIGMGTGYLLSEYLARGFLGVIGIDTPGNAQAVMQTFKADPRVVLYEAYGEHFCHESMRRARVTTLTCIVGDPGLTEHVTRLFLRSRFACELAFLLPVHACEAEAMLEGSKRADIKRLTVRLARSTGTRTVVVAVKTRGKDVKRADKYAISCTCRRGDDKPFHSAAGRGSPQG